MDLAVLKNGVTSKELVGPEGLFSWPEAINKAEERVLHNVTIKFRMSLLFFIFLLAY